MPLTTAYGHSIDNRKLNDRFVYNQETNYVDFDRQKGVELENLCLRLTQNFQLVSPTGTLNAELSKNKKVPHFSMCFRDRYTFGIPDENQLKT